MLGVIGGTGFYNLGKKSEEHDVLTPYGHASVSIIKIGNKEIAFIPRHGKNHSKPPHKVNYKANVYSLFKLGVEGAFATYASGIISSYKPGDLILLEDFIGFNTAITFYDDFSSGMKHIDFTNPFDKKLQDNVLEASKLDRIKIKRNGIIATTRGPRFETKAEINALKKMGANLVNMTSAYEITLFRELEIPFVSIAIGTNYACGVKKTPLTTGEVVSAMSSSRPKIDSIVSNLLKMIYSAPEE